MLRERLYLTYPAVLDLINEIDRTGMLPPLHEGAFTAFCHRPCSTFASIDDFNAYHAHKYQSWSWEQLRSFADVRSCHGTADAFHNIDLTDDLTEMVHRLWQHGLDVIAVDQTTPEHRVGGFCCVTWKFGVAGG